MADYVITVVRRDPQNGQEAIRCYGQGKPIPTTDTTIYKQIVDQIDMVAVALAVNPQPPEETDDEC